VERGQDARAGLEQHDARVGGVDGAEVAREHEAAKLSERAGELDARRAAADHDEREQALALVLVVGALGPLERDEHAAPHLDGVGERLEPRRVRLPVVVAEVARVGAGRDDDVVVRHVLAALDAHDLLREVHRGHRPQEHLSVVLPRQDGTDGRGDVRRRQARARDLVEQRLEEVMIGAVDERDPHVVARMEEGFGGRQAPEPSAYDHDVWRAHRVSPPCSNVGPSWPTGQPSSTPAQRGRRCRPS
jgi:hypothetical protein